MYAFKLESLLKHRKFLEECRQKELMVAQVKFGEARTILNKLKTKEKSMQLDWKQKQASPMSSDEMIVYTNFFHRIAREMETQKKYVYEVQEHVRQKREELLEAVKKRETLEKLKQKGLDQYQKKMLRQEQIDLSEIAINKYNREKGKR